MKKIILTGGGTAGHVTPNLALVPELQKRGYDILYIGSVNGMEKDLVEKAGLPYKGIASGKLRRYVDLKNLTDPARVVQGYLQARRIIKEYQPDVIFSKGGFVAVPVALAARRLGVPLVAHESDMTPGLANKISAPAAVKICCNFPETMHHIPEKKAVLTGSPIRAEILTGTREAGLAYAGFTGEKPVLMVIGGSLGAVHVNTAVRSCLSELLKKYDIIHCCGKGNVDEELKDKKGYVQYSYVNEPLKDLFAAADIVISRAGANAICELLALHKPNLLIPLSAQASRGDQILNAESFEKQGFSMVLREEELTKQKLLTAVDLLYLNRDKYRDRMAASDLTNGVGAVLKVIEGAARKAAKEKNA